ncbi:hypothetical protein JTE90_029211 [Oedothorax gibbosus]|uniref:Uncharacterized protein n=1 Tax=Oedothorax gibbosus TaxID=931172 RepID=A0AAV6VEC6_9ARAC|nr:hypothetical protein JTE90_029211 [Oedothorax gibbosus]
MAAFSLNDSSKGKNKGKSSKKRRAPDPPVIEGKNSASSDIKSNQSSASCFHILAPKKAKHRKSRLPFPIGSHRRRTNLVI